MIEFAEEKQIHCTPVANIKVIGVGGAGGNTVNSIIDSGYTGIEFIVANTDAQALELSKAPRKLQLGLKSTKGLGTGANPELGKRAAEEDLDKIMDLVEDADIVFLAGGMGGGTGSGALPVVARALKEKGILSIAIVTKPFIFEGKRRQKVAEHAIELLKKEVDTLLVVPNQKLLDVTQNNVSMIEAFAMINEILAQSVKGISDIIARPGHINVDFADVRTIMKDMGLAVMGTAKAVGPHRAQEAAMQAISSPLLENMSIAGAHGVLFNITGGTNLGLHEISAAASIIYEQAHEDAHIIIGSVIDEALTDEVIVTIIATGFNNQAAVVEEVVVQPSVAQPYYAQHGYVQSQPVAMQMQHNAAPVVAKVEQPAPVVEVVPAQPEPVMQQMRHEPSMVMQEARIQEGHEAHIPAQTCAPQQEDTWYEQSLQYMSGQEIQEEQEVPQEELKAAPAAEALDDMRMIPSRDEMKHDVAKEQGVVIDLSDLDVPTFLRRDMSNKQR